MNGAELLAELELAPPTYVDEAARERYTEVGAEIHRRLDLLEEATEEDRATHIEKFAFSASVVISNLWAAHHGRPMTDDEVDRFATTMRDFFITIR